MICPMCQGGKTLLKKEQGKGCYEVVLGICDKCHGTGEIEMTNEEYLRSANVNDMARCIATKLLELARHEYGIYDVVDYATIFEWLKEKHDDK